MGKFTVTNSSEKKIALRFKQSVHEKLAHNWRSVKGDIPEENGKAENYLDDLVQFWDGAKKKNPLWVPFSLGMGDVEELQQEIDRLSRKAKKKETFTEEEKYFLVALYSFIAWGGMLKWYPEASKLLRHYLDKSGDRLKIGSSLYQSSEIVQYAMAEMKKLISADAKNNGKLTVRADFSSQGSLKDTPRSFSEQCKSGAIVSNGTLMAEQDNKRLKNADNRFPLRAISNLVGNSGSRIRTKWGYPLYSATPNLMCFPDFRPLTCLMIPWYCVWPI
jgi:hypothetical protein